MKLKSQIWLMAPKHVEALADDLRRVDAFYASHPNPIAAEAAVLEAGRPLYGLEDGVARIPVAGPIMKTVPWVFEVLGIVATSTEDTRSAIEAAILDDEVDSILLDIDSPGGTINGLQALADDIYEARDKKPISAHAQDIAASAAYWIGSQASRFTASRGASIGSIGVYTVVDDKSGAAEKAGLKVHVVSSGGVKGGLAGGAPVSAEVLEDIQREIDDAAEQFVFDIARGRGMETDAVKELASGKTWLAPTAKKRGLIDAVESDRKALKRSVPNGGTQPKKKEVQKMDEEEVKALVEKAVSGLSTEIEGLKGSLEKTEARALAAEEALKATKGNQKDDLIKAAQAEGRIAPASLESVKAFASKSDVDELRAFLDTLPVVANTEVDGGMPSEDVASAQVSDDEIRIAKSYGLTVDELRKFGSADAISFTGELIEGGAN